MDYGGREWQYNRCGSSWQDDGMLQEDKIKGNFVLGVCCARIDSLLVICEGFFQEQSYDQIQCQICRMLKGKYSNPIRGSTCSTLRI
jgi:hypothetical protein